jgi:hypothetical protein
MWTDKTTIILISKTGNYFFYDSNGKQATIDKLNVKAYFCWGEYEMNITSF